MHAGDVVNEPSSKTLDPAQEAAGAFAYLAEQLAPRLAAPQPIDLSPDCCGMLSTLCLAQVRPP